MMYRDTDKAHVIDLCSDDEDYEEPAAVAPSKDDDWLTHNFQKTRPLKEEFSDSRPVKEEFSERCLPGDVDRASLLTNGVVRERRGDIITAGTFERRLGQGQENKEQHERKVASHGTVVSPSGIAGPTFLGPGFIPKNPVSTCQKQISRHFWKAGDYEVQPSSFRTLHNGMDHVRVHPKFLHTNATSHKWALGAIAELLDNSIDEVQNGATFVSVDKVTNPRDNSPALFIQDDGGGMDPDSIRQCMSLGYSRKTTNTTIGQYGNGFKTSTMRLGADVIVFTRCSQNSCVTQSVGLLSYTFLRASGHEDIVVPMVDFELFPTDGQPKMLVRSTKEDWLNNFSTLLQWSPYMTECELLRQFDDISCHGTKIIVYNLWQNDDGEPELDFDSDKQDIQLRGAPSTKLEKSDVLQRQLTNQHVATRLRYSLRSYSSILYLQLPSNFQMILRGKVVEHQSTANDLKFPERILYKPQVGNAKEYGGRDGAKEVSVITTIGFAKEAPMVNVHGFNVYHKNRLIMPFWKVFHENSSRGKGVIGVLEANFIEPAHDKQDFERTPILQRLEGRLKQMTIEYWNLHCELIGYQPPRQSSKSRGFVNNSSACPASFPVQAGATQQEAYAQNPVATGFPASVRAPSHSDVMVDIKPSYLGAQQRVISAHVDTGPDGKKDINLNTGSRNFLSASAPSTPPQPGSDVGMLSKHSEAATGEKCDDQKLGSSLHNDVAGEYVVIEAEGANLTQDALLAKTKVGQESLQLKRSAAEAALPDFGAVSNHRGITRISTSDTSYQEGVVSTQSPVCNSRVIQLLADIEQLQFRCAQHEFRERELENKVSQLELELLDTRSKYAQLLGEHCEIKQPKKEN